MIDKLRIVKQRFDEVSDLIIQPDIITDQKRYVQLNKEYKDLKQIVDLGAVYEEGHGPCSRAVMRCSASSWCLGRSSRAGPSGLS